MEQYTIKIRRLKDGTISIKRINNGFNAFEVLGFIDITKEEILKSISPGQPQGTKIITERVVK